MPKFWEILEREDGCLSLPRIAATVGFVVIVALLLLEPLVGEFPHLSQFMTFDSGLFVYCLGSKFLDLKAGPIKPPAGPKV